MLCFVLVWCLCFTLCVLDFVLVAVRVLLCVIDFVLVGVLVLVFVLVGVCVLVRVGVVFL